MLELHLAVLASFLNMQNPNEICVSETSISYTMNIGVSQRELSAAINHFSVDSFFSSLSVNFHLLGVSLSFFTRLFGRAHIETMSQTSKLLELCVHAAARHTTHGFLIYELSLLSRIFRNWIICRSWKEGIFFMNLKFLRIYVVERNFPIFQFSASSFP